MKLDKTKLALFFMAHDVYTADLEEHISEHAVIFHATQLYFVVTTIRCLPVCDLRSESRKSATGCLPAVSSWTAKSCCGPDHIMVWLCWELQSILAAWNWNSHGERPSPCSWRDTVIGPELWQAYFQRLCNMLLLVSSAQMSPTFSWCRLR